jgi:hypothetical protein
LENQSHIQHRVAHAVEGDADLISKKFQVEIHTKQNIQLAFNSEQPGLGSVYGFAGSRR